MSEIVTFTAVDDAGPVAFVRSQITMARHLEKSLPDWPTYVWVYTTGGQSVQVRESLAEVMHALAKPYTPETPPSES